MLTCDCLHLEITGASQIMPSMPVSYLSFAFDLHLSSTPHFNFLCHHHFFLFLVLQSPISFPHSILKVFPSPIIEVLSFNFWKICKILFEAMGSIMRTICKQFGRNKGIFHRSLRVPNVDIAHLSTYVTNSQFLKSF